METKQHLLDTLGTSTLLLPMVPSTASVPPATLLSSGLPSTPSTALPTVSSASVSAAVATSDGHGSMINHTNGSAPSSASWLVRTPEVSTATREVHVEGASDQAGMTSKQMYNTGLIEKCQELEEELKVATKERDKCKRQLTTLKQHLIEQEDTYTQQVLELEQEKQQLEQAVESAHKANEEVQAALHQGSAWGDSLKATLVSLENERDEQAQECQRLRMQLSQQLAANTNLEKALTSLEEERQLVTLQQGVSAELGQVRTRVTELEKMLLEKQKEVNDAREHVNRLQLELAQVHLNEGQLLSLQSEVHYHQQRLGECQVQLDAKTSALSDASVENTLLRNAVKGYLLAKDKEIKTRCLGLLCDTCDFTQDERIRVGYAPRRGWFSGWLGGQQQQREQQRQEAVAAAALHQEGTLSQEFVSFLLQNT
eukprot:m.5525 g.5525  ORF g.5525 m.5525 type:complete len:427 (-) comp5037_c0_seq1:357-1637(-)